MKTGFLIYITGILVAVAGVLMHPGMLQPRQSVALAKESGPETAAAAPENLSADLQQVRNDIITNDEKITALSARLGPAYTQLMEKRKALNPSDQAAVRAFNLEAANYAHDKNDLVAAQADIARLQKQESILLSQRAERDAAVRQVSQKTVVMYSTSWCPACKAAKQYFAQKHVAYRDVDVESSPEASREFQSLGGSAVPLIIVNGEKMTGFSPQRLDQLL